MIKFIVINNIIEKIILLINFKNNFPKLLKLVKSEFI